MPIEQIISTLKTKSQSALVGASRNGDVPVVVNVDIDSLYIANPGAGALLGSTASSVAGAVTIVDAVSGEPLGDQFRVLGVTEARPTVFGAAAIKPPQQELAIISDDFAKRLKIAIFGE
ncbi:hypothetical protein [Paramylibacter kogurei]|uniref:hypothetical protein n=1 Tax=Paramylibacter kogurei TaxID=1889778 RepID=UPI001F0ADF9B|nr:hypothetical protein [Amylibacter kogurei]